MHSLTLQQLSRPGESGEFGTKIARVSIDFVVDGQSLLEHLLKPDGGGDFMGCFVQGFAAENMRKKVQLQSGLEPDTDEGRCLLYVCPECGDVGCGAYGAKVRITEQSAEWYDFAYENGYEPGQSLPSVGPFCFALSEYNAALNAAGAA